MATLTGQSFLTELQALKKARTERDNLIKEKKAIQQRIVEFVKEKTEILQHREELLGSLYINNYFNLDFFLLKRFFFSLNSCFNISKLCLTI